MPEMHELMAAHGDGAKAIWMTEYGAPTAGPDAVSEATLATMIEEAFALAATWEWAGPLFLFTWQDSTEGSFGLHRHDGTPKLAAVNALSASSTPVTAPVPAAAPLAATTLAPGQVLELAVAGVHGVAADASAVVLNLTATNPAADGYLTVFPCGEAVPNASSVNYTAGQTVPNLTITKVGRAARCASPASPPPTSSPTWPAGTRPAPTTPR